MDVSRAVESASGPGPLFGHGPLPTGAALDVVSFKWVSGVLPRIIFITTPSRLVELVEMPLLLARVYNGRCLSGHLVVNFFAQIIRLS